MRLLTLSLLDTNILLVPHLTFSVRLIATKSEPGRRETPTLPWRGAMSTLHTFWRCRVRPSRWKDPSRFFFVEGRNQQKKPIDWPKHSFRDLWIFHLKIQISRRKTAILLRILWNFRILKQTVGVSKRMKCLFPMIDECLFCRGSFEDLTKTNSQHRQQTPSKCTHNSTFHSPIQLLISIDFAWKKRPSHHCKTRASQKNTVKRCVFSSFTRFATIFPISFL